MDIFNLAQPTHEATLRRRILLHRPTEGFFWWEEGTLLRVLHPVNWTGSMRECMERSCRDIAMADGARIARPNPEDLVVVLYPDAKSARDYAIIEAELLGMRGFKPTPPQRRDPNRRTAPRRRRRKNA